MATRSYGKRRSLSSIDTGVRPVAPTYGRRAFLSYSQHSQATYASESQAERLVACMLDIDPDVASYRHQQLSVDLFERRLLNSNVERKAVLQKYREMGRQHAIYTPDFLIHQSHRASTVLEVKLEGFEGDKRYRQKLAEARCVLNSNGYDFRTLVFPIGWNHPLRHNIPLLHSSACLRNCRLNGEQLSILERLSGDDGATLLEICAALEISASHIPALVQQGILQMDWVLQRFNADTHLHWAAGDLEHMSVWKELAC